LLSVDIIFSVSDKNYIIGILTSFTGIAFVSDIDEKMIDLFFILSKNLSGKDLERTFDEKIVEFNKKDIRRYYWKGI
jgi:hypothetical protein